MAAQNSIKQTLASKNTWIAAAAAFGVQFSVLTWQRYVSKSIENDIYKTRLANSAASTLAGVAGAASGGALGAFLGNFIAPGIGGIFGYGFG